MPDPTTPAPATRTLEVYAECADDGASTAPIPLAIGGTDFVIPENDPTDNANVKQCLELQYRIQEQQHSCSSFKVVFTGQATGTQQILVTDIKFRSYEELGSAACRKSSN